MKSSGCSAPGAWVRPQVVSLLRRCLQKDPRQRLRDIGDARYELEHASTTVVAAADKSIRPSRRLTVAWAAGAAALAIAAGLGA